MSWGGRGKGRGGNQPRYASSKDKSQKQDQRSFELKFEHQIIPLQQINIDAPDEFQISVGSGFSAKKIVHKIINGKDVVIKALDIANSRIWEELQREVKVFEASARFGQSTTDEVLKEGKKHILSYYGVNTDPKTSTGFIVLEKADNNLLNILKLHTDMTDNSTELIPNKFWTQCAMDIAIGMHFLHSANIYHRDLQMENCLLFLDDNPERPSIKVSDFGGSLFHSDPPISFCGNRRLTAPEILQQRTEKQPLSAYSTSSDVFMFGCLLYEMAEGWRGSFRLFPGVADPQAFRYILDGKRPTFSVQRSSRIRPQFAELIQSCWDQDPKKRPSFLEAYQKLQQILLSLQSTASENNNNNSTTPSNTTSLTTTPSKHPHTHHLYMVDEVLSALEKSIRRNQVENSLYWSSELIHSKLPHLVWEKLFTAVTADISIASPQIVIAVSDAYLKWKETHDSVILLQVTHLVASAPKNRIVVNLVLNAMRQVEQHLIDAENGNGAALANLLPPQGAKLPAKWTLLDLYITLLYNISEPNFSEIVISLIKSISDSTSKGFVDALCQIESFSSYSQENSQENSVLRIFHAALLLQNPQLLHGSPLPIPAKNLFQQQLMPVPGLKGRHPTGIPTYAIDRSTLRGTSHTRDTVFATSCNTLPCLEEAAKEHQVNICEWGPAEIAKSHGCARIRFLNRKLGTPTFGGDEVTTAWWIPQTQEVLVTLKNHHIEMKDINEFLFHWEEAYGSEMIGLADIMKIHSQRMKQVFG